jgi:ABC-2 type transport system ATP-binding protein
VLELDGLTKRYGDVVALDACGFSVRPGRIVGFLGPNGAGKTSAMRAIFGLLRLDGGTVAWMGRSVTHDERRQFGYMPEMRGLYPACRCAAR